MRGRIRQDLSRIRHRPVVGASQTRAQLKLQLPAQQSSDLRRATSSRFSWRFFRFLAIESKADVKAGYLAKHIGRRGYGELAAGPKIGPRSPEFAARKRPRCPYYDCRVAFALPRANLTINQPRSPRTSRARHLAANRDLYRACPVRPAASQIRLGTNVLWQGPAKPVGNVLTLNVT